MTHRAPPMHNIPLDNLSSTLSFTSANKNIIPSELNVEKYQKPQSAQILVPSALNLNALDLQHNIICSLGQLVLIYDKVTKELTM